MFIHRPSREKSVIGEYFRVTKFLHLNEEMWQIFYAERSRALDGFLRDFILEKWRRNTAILKLVEWIRREMPIHSLAYNNVFLITNNKAVHRSLCALRKLGYAFNFDVVVEKGFKNQSVHGTTSMTTGVEVKQPRGTVCGSAVFGKICFHGGAIISTCYKCGTVIPFAQHCVKFRNNP